MTRYHAHNPIFDILGRAVDEPRQSGGGGQIGTLESEGPDAGSIFVRFALQQRKKRMLEMPAFCRHTRTQLIHYFIITVAPTLHVVCVCVAECEM